jgi:hypothetical protein
MGNRYYPIGDKELASVTTITGLADKSDALIPWAVNCAVDYVESNLSRCSGTEIGNAQYLDRDDIEDRLEAARTKWREVRDEAGDIGTQVHDALEAWLRTYLGKQLNDSRAGKFAPENELAKSLYFASVEKLVTAGKVVKVLAVEQKVVNEDEWYAGRFDALLEVDGEIWLIDFKTGASFYPEWGMQLAAYAEAWDNKVNAYLGTPISAYIDRIKVLRLDKKTLRAHWKEYGGEKDTLSRDDYMTAFQGLRDAFYILKAKKAVKQSWLESRR